MNQFADTFDENAQSYLEKILAILDIEATVVQEDLDDTTTCYRIDCKADDARMLIGRNGQTLEALQFVVRQMCRSNLLTHNPFVIDVLDYRSRRRRTMEDNAKKGAVAVLNGDSERFELDPMNPYDRRLVHNYLQENFPELSSDSEGEGEERHIVISYRGLDEDAPEKKQRGGAVSQEDEDEYEAEDFDGEDEEEYEEADEKETSKKAKAVPGDS
ncbi:MAG: R3H domain-containing nucleic acid-binding protein [Candidatus Melainabacteria bacterium]|nr:R3H domain-containing nucleic acid-binding protein [Candidatus Melainabacteria bacterium]